MKFPAFIPFFVCGALLASGCGPGAKGPAGAGMAPPPPAVGVASVQRGSVDVFREYAAELKPVQSVLIRTRVNGTLESVHFLEGDLVRQGQILFQLDPAPFQAEVKGAEAALARARAGVSQALGRVTEARAAVAQADARLQKARTQVNLQKTQADLARAQSDLDAAERELRRHQKLKEEGAIPPQLYDQVKDRRDLALAQRNAQRAELTNTRVGDRADVGVAQADVASARASLESSQAAVQSAEADVLSAQSQVEAAELNLSYSTIRAPFTGTIGRLNLDRGTMIVMGNAVLATLNSSNPIYADFSVSESEYLQLKAGPGFSGSPFELTLTNGKAYPEKGQFVMTENSVDSTTGTLTVRARFKNPESLLKPGGFGRVRMKNHRLESAVLIPQKAVFSNQSLSSVYVVMPDNTVAPRAVELGDRVKDQVVVTKGLEAGENIVIDGLQKLRPGMKIATAEAASK